MALEEDKIKDLFSSKLNSFEPELPASIWSGIDQLLSEAMPAPTPDGASEAANSSSSSSSSTSSSAAAKSTVALKTTMIAAGVAATVALGVYVAYESEEPLAPAIEEVAPAKIIEVPAIEPEVEETTLILSPSDFVKPRVVAAPVVEEERVFVEGPKLETEKTKELNTKAKPDVFSVDEIEELPPLSVPKFFKEDISIGVHANSGLMTNKVNGTGGNLLFSRDDRSTELVDALKDENKDYELSHSQPVSIGLTVSKNLSRRLSIETGLVFTHLSSKIKSNSAINIREEQNFGYLGIPIYLNYNFYDIGKAKIYVSLGVTMQKDIYGKYTSKILTGPELMESGLNIPTHVLYSEPSYLKRNINQSNWQFSGHLNIGASYPIYNKLYIHTSVGGAYYFDAGNEYRTIFSDKKFQLDLNLGLRFDF